MSDLLSRLTHFLFGPERCPQCRMRSDTVPYFRERYGECGCGWFEWHGRGKL